MMALHRRLGAMPDMEMIEDAGLLCGQYVRNSEFCRASPIISYGFALALHRAQL